MWYCEIRSSKGKRLDHVLAHTIEDGMAWLIHHLVRFEEYRKIAQQKAKITMIIKASDIF